MEEVEEGRGGWRRVKEGGGGGGGWGMVEDGGGVDCKWQKLPTWRVEGRRMVQAPFSLPLAQDLEAILISEMAVLIARPWR